MKKEIKQLFHQIRTLQGHKQSLALAYITLLLDLALKRGEESIFDKLNLKKIYLTKKDANNILKQMTVEMFNKKIPLAIRVGIAGGLGQFDKINCLKANLIFLGENHHNLDAQEVYSTLASINPQYFKKQFHRSIKKLFDEYDIRQVLRKLGERKETKVQESLFHMWGKIKLVGPLHRQEAVEYFKSIVWKIKNDYVLLDSSEIHSLLKTIPDDCFTERYKKEVSKFLANNNFVRILDKLEARTYETYYRNQKKSCPRKLWSILKPDKKEKAKEKKKYEKSTILLKRKVKYIKDKIRR